MPLKPPSTLSLSPSSLTTLLTLLTPSTSSAPKKSFIIIYASPDPTTGKMWCSDCVDTEPLITKKFEGKEDVDCWVVFAGHRGEWRSKDGNLWRKEPFAVEKLPTLIKVQEGKWERLVEGDVYDQVKLDAFVDA